MIQNCPFRLFQLWNFYLAIKDRETELNAAKLCAGLSMFQIILIKYIDTKTPSIYLSLIITFTKEMKLSSIWVHCGINGN